LNHVSDFSKEATYDLEDVESFPTELVDLSLRATRTGMQSHLIAVEMSWKIFV
jgi:hypothetical protein